MDFMSNLYAVELVPKWDILVPNKKFRLYCDGVRTPYSYNPPSIQGVLGVQNDITIVQSTLNLLKIQNLVDPKLFSGVYAFIQTKRHNTVGS